MKELKEHAPVREISPLESRGEVDLPILPKEAKPEDYRPSSSTETYDKIFEKFNLVDSEKKVSLPEKEGIEKVPDTLEKGEDGKYYDKETGRSYESVEAWRKHLETLVKRYNSTADFYKMKADKEWARFKNSDANGESEAEKWEHYHSSQEYYTKEKECREKAAKTQEMLDNN